MLPLQSGTYVVDLNYLLGRHQRSLMCAASAAGPEARHSHLGLVTGYAHRIRRLQIDLGASALLKDAG